MSKIRTEINQLGEFGLIERLAMGQTTFRQPGTQKGIGDDTAVVESHGPLQLITTDMLLEGVHFDLSYMPIMHLGYKSVSVNVSDIAAMNGTARQIVVALALSNRFSVEAVEALYQGIQQACEDYKIDLVGGDTTASRSGLVISITAIGDVDASKISYRSGANDGDILCVTGDLGAAYMGLQVLEREKQVFLANPNMQPDIEKYKYLAQRQMKPSARTDIIHELKDLNMVPTSMIDISDGLASEILHLSKNSGLGFKIYEDKLPIDQMTYQTAVEFKLDPITCILNGGEDYELLFTISQKDYEQVKNHPDIHFIGYASADVEGGVLITKGGNAVKLKAQGWNHFPENE